MVPASTLSDADIVKRVREGDRALFEILMRRHNQRIYRAARAVVSENEVSWIEALRKASDNTDPPLTAKRAKILRAIFGKIGPYPGQ